MSDYPAGYPARKSRSGKKKPIRPNPNRNLFVGPKVPHDVVDVGAEEADTQARGKLDGNLLVVVIVKSWVKLLTRRLICFLVVYSCAANQESACLSTQLLTMTITHKFPSLRRIVRHQPESLSQ